MPARPARQPTGRPGKASQPGWPGGPAGLVWDHFGARKAIIHGIWGQYRTCSNSVSCKVTRDARKLVPQRLPEGQNGVGFNRVSCQMDKTMISGTFCEFPSQRNTIRTRGRCVLVVFIRNYKIDTNLDPNFLDRD